MLKSLPDRDGKDVQVRVIKDREGSLRPKSRFMDVVKEDIMVVGVRKEYAKD